MRIARIESDPTRVADRRPEVSSLIRRSGVGDTVVRIATAEGPRWGRIERPGLGVEVDEDKLMRCHEAYLRDGAFAPYGDRFDG